MKEITYKIEFFDYWHCGSGLSAGADVDALVIKDNNGLPYIPGKTLKGLIREATENIIKLRNSWDENKETFIEFFGYNTETANENEEKQTRGCGFFGNATISSEEKSTILKEGLSRYLYTNISSTAIDGDGIAKRGSLRRAEVCIPLTLTATIHNIPESIVPHIEDALLYIKRMGINRHRGLGRCQFTKIK